MSRGVFLEQARSSDVPALEALETACFSHPWTRVQIAEEVAAGPPGAVLVLRGMGPGGLEVRAMSAHRLVADEMHVLDVAVHPAWRRRGLARFLLGVAFRRAAVAGARTALLEVRAGNEAALRLYEALGFARDGLRRAYYREPVEDAILLRRDGIESLRPGRDC